MKIANAISILWGLSTDKDSNWHPYTAWAAFIEGNNDYNPLPCLWRLPPLRMCGLSTEQGRRHRGSGPGVGAGRLEFPHFEAHPPWAPQTKWHVVQGTMESRHPESQSASLPAPLPPPHFEKSGYAPATDEWRYQPTDFAWILYMVFKATVLSLKTNRVCHLWCNF